MKTLLISLGVAFLAVVIVYISIFFLDPGMNVEIAFGIIFYTFFGSGILTALVLGLRSSRASRVRGRA
jgi:hypothetical protein